MGIRCGGCEGGVALSEARSAVAAMGVLTPADLEARYGTQDGWVVDGELGLDQLWVTGRRRGWPDMRRWSLGSGWRRIGCLRVPSTLGQCGSW